MDFKKAFQDAQSYHLHAIQHGSEETKKAHLAHHIKSGDYTLLNKKSPKGKT